jgi:adenosylcobyric acid synthase
MFVAKLADAPVLLVGDIDRGGVFAAFVGTLELLDPDERDRVAAFVINKFRGDLRLLTPGLDFLTARTGKPVLGVIPHVPRLRIADEDSVSLDDRAGRARPGPDRLDIAVVRLPRISNYDDFEALEHEPGVVVRFVDRPEEVRGADLVILPGSKSTASDLAWLRASGIAAIVTERARERAPVLGICGGCQMLGQTLEDPHGVESPEPLVTGLGLLPIRTRFAREKTTAQVRARVRDASFLCAGVAAGEELEGYEIHMGLVEAAADAKVPFVISARNGQPEQALDGAVDASGSVVGTMLHGVLENPTLRRGLLARLRAQKGLPEPTEPATIPAKLAEYDRLEAALRASIDRELLFRIAGLQPRR